MKQHAACTQKIKSFGIASLVFLVSRMTPGDPLVTIVGERNLNNPEIVAAAILAGVAVLENFGLRQLHSWWRLVALITWRGRAPTWVSAPRQGFQRVAS